MRNSFAFGTFAAALFALPLLIVSPAHANISACGNLDVDASATCELRVKDCKASCTLVSVQAVCAVQGEATCEASCPKVPSVSCTASCEETCAADCKVKPAEYDCSTKCNADASANCDAQCNAAGDKAQCEAACQATFSANCDTSCKGHEGSVDCDAVCQGRCEGSCTAQTNLECQVSCQGDLSAACQTQVEGGCEVDCSDPKGALFCNGQYVDHNGTVDECIHAIQALFPKITITASGSSSADCSDNTCSGEAEGSASASCAFSPRGASGSDVAGGFAMFAAIGAVCMRRRRQRKAA